MHMPDAIYVAVLTEFLAIALFVWTRPRWKIIGPSLADSYVAGLLLFAAGSIYTMLVYGENRSYDVALIGLYASISSLIGASLSSYVLRERIGNLNFWQPIKTSEGEHRSITIGFVVCIAVCFAYFIAIVTNAELLRVITSGLAEGNTVEGRLAIMNGTYGYLGVGYVKEFRDILLPILCAAAIFSNSYRNRSLVIFGLVVCAFGIFITGDRLFVVILILTQCTAYAIGWRYGSRKIFPIYLALPLLALLAAQLFVMTKLAGHIPPPAIKSVQQPQASAIPTTPSIENQVAATAKLIEAIATEITQSIKNSPAWMAIRQIVERSIVVVPNENIKGYDLWASPAPVYGRGWISDLSGVIHSGRRNMATTLAEKLYGRTEASSPLSQPADIYYNWGIVGTLIFPALFAFGFLLMDCAIVASRSSMLFGAKIFLFFTIPIIYAPYGFMLYGGAAVLILMFLVHLLRRGYFASFGLPAPPPAELNPERPASPPEVFGR